jgi:hypothetical protein
VPVPLLMLQPSSTTRHQANYFQSRCQTFDSLQLRPDRHENRSAVFKDANDTVSRSSFLTTIVVGTIEEIDVPCKIQNPWTKTTANQAYK